MRSIVGTAVTCLSLAAFAQAADAQVSSSSEDTLEEIVVTAQKREERLQDVPISISVLGGNALDSSSDRGVIEAVSRVPGVFAPLNAAGARYGGNSMLAIRGVSSPTVGSGTTAYYIDNVPYGLAQQAFVPDTNPYDLDRVEVLRGPQGTLYGASALNGVVRVLTRSPNFNDTEFKARASLSNTDHGSGSYSGDAAFNMPLIEDKLAARVVLGYQDLGGWIDKPNTKDFNDTEKVNVRVKLAAKLTEKFSAGVSGWISRIDNGGLPTSSTNGLTQISLQKEPTSTDFDTFSLDLNYDADSFSIKSASSYIDYKIRGIFENSYPDASGGCFLCLFPNRNPFKGVSYPNGTVMLSNDVDSTVLAEELVLSSTGAGPWRWTLGSMYRDAQDDSVQNTSISVSPGIYSAESKSVAVFGELTRVFAGGRFEVTGGLRYFRDKVHYWEDSRSSIPFGALPNGIPPGGLQSVEDTFNKTTLRFVATWHPNEESTLYTSYSQGFRSGIVQGFDITAAYGDAIPSAQPDTLKNYEIGGKAKLGRLNLETAIYYIDWQDAQQTSGVVINGVSRAVVFNSPDSISGPGVDLALAYSPVDSLTLTLSYGWNDLTFDAPLYAGAVLVSAKGERRPSSPKTTAGASIDYNVALGGSGYRGRLSASANYIGEQLADVNGNTGERFRADAMTVARAGFTVMAPRNWTATLFLDNATDEDGRFPSATTAPYFDTYIRPRTYGLQFEYTY